MRMRAALCIVGLWWLSVGAFAQSVVPLPNIPGREDRHDALLHHAAPDFLLPSVEGGTVKLSQLRGRPTVLCFWAFWCDTWREVHKGLTELDVPCQRVTVCVDCQWLQQLNGVASRPYLALLDPGSVVSGRYGVRAVPTVFILDAEGTVQARFEGWPGTRKIAARLRSLTRSK